MKRKILTFAVFAMIFPCLSLATSVYKWTDEDGVIHFGDRKPNGQQTESVDIRTGKKASTSRVSPQEQVQQIEEEEAQREADENVSAVEKARRKQRAANCETARTNVTVLESGSRVKITEDDEQRYLTPEEIEQKLSEFEEIAEQNCEAPEES